MVFSTSTFASTQNSLIQEKVLQQESRSVSYNDNFKLQLNGRAYSNYINFNSQNVYITPSVYQNNSNDNFTVRIYLQEENSNVQYQMSFKNNSPRQGYFYGLNPNKRYRFSIWIDPCGAFLTNYDKYITIIIGTAGF